MSNYTELEIEIDNLIQEKVLPLSQSNLPYDYTSLASPILLNKRQEYLKKLAAKTGRNVIAYYSTWVQSGNLTNPNPELSITDNDINGFMNAVSKCEKDKGLDLILHTPGGGTTATESIIKYLRKIFNSDIRVIVPHMAMSAGTMIACASKEIIMGKQSSLGPIDTQYRGVPAEGVLAEFKRATEETINEPNKSLIWKEIINKYTPTFIGECENAVKLSKKIVSESLKSGMFKNLDEEESDKRVDKILGELGSHEASMVHDKHYDSDTCKELGLNVKSLESDQELQDIVLSIHHLYFISTYKQPSIKYIESNNDMVWVISGNR